MPSLPSPVIILHALKLTHQSLGPLLFHKYASPNHSSFRFETSQEAKLHPPRQHIVNSRHVSLHRNAKKSDSAPCCSAAAQATRRGRRIQRGGCTRHQQTRRVTTFTEAKWWLADAHRAHVRGGVRESAPAGNRAKCEREHAVEVGREQLLHESGLSLAGVVGSAGQCGGAVGRVRGVT